MSPEALSDLPLVDVQVEVARLPEPSSTAEQIRSLVRTLGDRGYRVDPRMEREDAIALCAAVYDAASAEEAERAIADAPEGLRPVARAFRGGWASVRARLLHATDDARAARRLAAELLGLGPGCRDGGCLLAGPGTRPGAMRTNGGCKCLAFRGDRCLDPTERRALRAAVDAAAQVLADALEPARA